ncbi:unnamed protein product [Lampetra fluviatilis]
MLLVLANYPFLSTEVESSLPAKENMFAPCPDASGAAVPCAANPRCIDESINRDNLTGRSRSSDRITALHRGNRITVERVRVDTGQQRRVTRTAERAMGHGSSGGSGQQPAGAGKEEQRKRKMSGREVTSQRSEATAGEQQWWRGEG